MSLAEDIAGALAAEVYRRVGLVTTLCVGAAEDTEPSVRFTELHQNAVAAALAAAFDGVDAAFKNALEIDAHLHTREVPNE